MSTNIEWTDETWNPITGCSHAGSPGCDNCYARRMANRLRGRYGYPQDEPFRVTWHEDKAYQPHKWKKPRKIFVCSMSDIAHPDVTHDMFSSIMATISTRDRHTFLMLTKRPERLYEMLMKKGTNQDDGWLRHMKNCNPVPNLWIGVTAENQAAADERIPILLDIPASVRFVSVEPMLGPVDINCWLHDVKGVEDHRTYFKRVDRCDFNKPPLCSLDWVICGGETGPGSRPIDPHWVWDLQKQCEQAGVPFFFKGWGTGSERRGRRLLGLEWNQFPGHYKAE